MCSIVETIKFCGWQEISLRDSGLLTVNDPTIKDGNFRSLLRIRMKCGDQKLIIHSQNMSLNTLYLSPTIKNDVMEICGKLIQKQIAADINEAGAFSILVDKTADIAS